MTFPKKCKKVRFFAPKNLVKNEKIPFPAILEKSCQILFGEKFF